ncbi:MAG: TetR/AcrR family transcriptional regulator [Thermoanaerobaculia bacterium]|nr:MAG: TetR/AcrR family transcriptional regulator [Thermoanaerobaculia bacterium]
MVQSAPMPRLEASGPAAGRRRREILAAASRLFRERGLHATGMREIAAALGMTAGNLYYYLPSKQDLLAYCQEETLGQLLTLARDVRASPRRPDERLRDLIEGHVTVLNETTPGSLAHLEVNEVPAARRPTLIARRRGYEDAVRELIEEGIAAGVFRALDSRLAALALLGALNWTVKWFQPDGRKTAAEVGREFADLLVRGLLATSDPTRRAGTDSEAGPGGSASVPAKRHRRRGATPVDGNPPRRRSEGPNGA